MSQDNPKPNQASPMGGASLYLDYESYDFEITTWEELDPKTFSTGTAIDNDKMSWFDKYINHKIKFFAYLNFFSNDPLISGIRNDFETKYSNTLNDLNEDTIVKNFTDEAAYTTQENKFIAKLSGKTKETYEFFKKHYDNFFNTVGNGFFVNIKSERLIEDAVIKEGNRKAKKIILWSSRNNNYLNKAIRAFPLMYYSPKNNNKLSVQYVCFIDGQIRNSIDFFDNNKILRVYLPILEANELNLEATLRDNKVPTFTARPEALSNYLKNSNQVSLYFNPDVKPFESKLTLEVVGTNKDLRGCSIY